MSAIALGWVDVLAAALLLVLNGAVSVAFRLGLERSLAVAALRAVVQLALVGWVLQLVFAASSLPLTLLVGLVMVAVGAHEVWARQTSPVGGLAVPALGGGTLLAVGMAAAVYVTTAALGATPWWKPAVFLPVLGMILGNALTGIALALETVTQTATSERAAIEARLAHGATRLEALEGPLRRALITATMPILNGMAVAGVVSLPGMMTGQILAGADPVEAAKYQMTILFAISGSTALAVVAAAVGGVLLVTDERARLRLDRLRPG